MKKIIITFFVYFIITSNFAYASSSCNIADSTAQVLSDYIKNNQQVISNITNELSTKSSEADKTIKNYTIGAFNSIINWTGYESYFNYYVIFPLSNDLTKEVKRDYRLLNNEGEGLNKYLKVVSKKGYAVEIENACNGVTNCELEGNAIDIVIKLIKNQSAIINIYRKTVMGKEIGAEDYQNLILVDNTNNKFIQELENNYGLANNCLKEEGSFFTIIWEKIKEIGTLNEAGKKGIDEWKEAIALLTGSEPTENLEKELLKKELERQGISGDRAQAIMKNLEEFNKNGGYSLDNNFITNTFGHLGDVIDYEVDKFQTNVIDEFSKNANDGETTTINSILSDNEKVKVNLNITEAVSNIYNNELPYIEISNLNAYTSRVDIINMHSNLNKGILILKDLQQIAERVCNKQSSGEGVCTTN